MSKPVDPTSGQFIDPLFAVIIAAAVSETIIPWVKTPIVPSPFQLCVVFIGFANLLLSWFGYHKSVSRKPIRGSLRFIVTVVLLPVYLLSIMFYTWSSFHLCLVYGTIFLLWHFWEWLKSLEHDDIPMPFFRGLFTTYNGIIALAVGLTGISEAELSMLTPTLAAVPVDWIGIVLISVAILWLRISKSLRRNDEPVKGLSQALRTLFLGAPTARFASTDEPEKHSRS